MTKHHPVMWLKGRATTGLKDMPGNAAWVTRRGRRPCVDRRAVPVVPRRVVP
jgi:hypothetical protein